MCLEIKSFSFLIRVFHLSNYFFFSLKTKVKEFQRENVAKLIMKIKYSKTCLIQRDVYSLMGHLKKENISAKYKWM